MGSAERDRYGEEWLSSADLLALVGRLGRRYRLSSEEREDLLQEIRIALWLRGLDAKVAITWVSRVAMHKAVDLVRRRARDSAHDRLASYQQHDLSSQALELEYLLDAQVDRLPARLRKLYELHYRQGFSEREISARLGISRASVRWLDRLCRRVIGGLDR